VHVVLHGWLLLLLPLPLLLLPLLLRLRLLLGRLLRRLFLRRALPLRLRRLPLPLLLPLLLLRLLLLGQLREQRAQLVLRLVCQLGPCVLVACKGRRACGSAAGRQPRGSGQQGCGRRAWAHAGAWACPAQQRGAPTRHGAAAVAAQARAPEVQRRLHVGGQRLQAGASRAVQAGTQARRHRADVHRPGRLRAGGGGGEGAG
jgi:hypothetical protein